MNTISVIVPCNYEENHCYFFTKYFYKLINKISKADIVDGARDFRLMNRTMVKAISQQYHY